MIFQAHAMIAWEAHCMNTTPIFQVKKALRLIYQFAMHCHLLPRCFTPCKMNRMFLSSEKTPPDRAPIQLKKVSQVNAIDAPKATLPIMIQSFFSISS